MLCLIASITGLTIIVLDIIALQVRQGVPIGIVSGEVWSIMSASSTITAVLEYGEHKVESLGARNNTPGLIGQCFLKFGTTSSVLTLR